MRRAAKVDTNQAEIVEALRAAGATVTPTHMVGNGFPDLAVGYSDGGIRRTTLLEVKNLDGKAIRDPDRLRLLTMLTPDERTWHEAWMGEVQIVTCPDDALRAIGAL